MEQTVYARWSYMDWQSDVYVYHSDVFKTGMNWRIDVAARRRQMLPGIEPPYGHGRGWLWQQEREAMWTKEQRRKEALELDLEEENPNQIWLDLSEISEYAGEYFNVATAGECADLLAAIKADGLNVPEFAIKKLREEQLAADGEIRH